ncbi:hypothetical protein GP486_003876 [Trichoglossum hirsutum]|uniref:Carboxylic ester hydrolase n=1 Tax=Trichoglossum hirsutum TaxID=265104 RepID=A0A9P8LCA6_9PEZI|nr:hypothetical protein GP486_003876 [Trichoglossum hirsutum]
MRCFGRRLVVWLSVFLYAAAADDNSLPTVDLEYEIHQASSFNSTGGYYNFSNIRYGQAPVGDLRFSAPLPPLTDRSTVQKGDVGTACPQALPVWYVRGLAEANCSCDLSSVSDDSFIIPADPREGEDCLFLDVLVPEKIFAKAGNTSCSGAPVMVWIYGGGYTFGEKANSGSPAGLILRSQQVDETGDGVIYVALNYRGGAFGFLSGPNLQKNGSANAGLLDQRLALEWVQNYIHLFGGDKNRVTVFGQSAGGGSVMHQITAYGGNKGKVPFQQAILQSPGFQPYPGNWQQDQLLQQYLQSMNVSTIQEARQLPYDTLRKANTDLVAKSPYGSFTFSPAVDGDFVTGLPGTLLLHGSFDVSIKVMVGYNAQETLHFVDPANNDNSAFAAGIKRVFPDIQPAVVDYITQTLYPEVYDGTYPYTDAKGRAMLSDAEASFTCNTYFLDRAFGNQTYAYRFSIPPAFHGLDVPYTYFNGPDPRVTNETIALAMQSYITTFAITGQPNRQDLPEIPLYGENSQILDLNVTGMAVISDPEANERCEWWQKALYF